MTQEQQDFLNEITAEGYDVTQVGTATDNEKDYMAALTGWKEMYESIPVPELPIGGNGCMIGCMLANIICRIQCGWPAVCSNICASQLQECLNNCQQ